MRVNVTKNYSVVVWGALCTIVTSGSLSADDTAPLQDDIKFVFSATDTSGNGVIDKSEILMDVIQNFRDADTDQDGHIEKEEAGEEADTSEFTDGDTDKDGKISIEEAISEKLSDFKSADTDGSGTLTLEELTSAIVE